MSTNVRLARDAALSCLTEYQLHSMVTLVNSLLHATIFNRRDKCMGLYRLRFTFAACDLSSRLGEVWFGTLNEEHKVRLKKLYSLDKISNPRNDALFNHWVRTQKESNIGRPERILIKSILKKVGCRSVAWTDVSTVCQCGEHARANEPMMGIHVDTHKNCINWIPLLCPRGADSIVRQKSSSGVLVLPCSCDQKIIPAYTLSFQIVGSQTYDDALALKSPINDPR